MLPDSEGLRLQRVHILVNPTLTGGCSATPQRTTYATQHCIDVRHLNGQTHHRSPRRCYCSSKPESLKHRFKIVVLDTVTTLLGPQLSDISSQGNVIVTLFFFFLNQFMCVSGYRTLIVTLLPPLSHPTACFPFQIRIPCINWRHERASAPTGHAEMTMFLRLLRQVALGARIVHPRQ